MSSRKSKKKTVYSPPQAEPIPATPVTRNRQNLSFSFFSIAALLCISFYFFNDTPLLDLKQERNEYIFIAEALTRGFGYANPFGNCSYEEHKELCLTNFTNTPDEEVVITPTAWMPPAYPFLLAVIFKLFGLRSTASLYVLLTLKLVGFGILIYWIQKILFGQRSVYLDRILLCALFLTVLALNDSGILKQIHDVWVIAPLVVIVTGYIVKAYTQPFRKHDTVILILLGFVTPLATATLGYTLLLLALVASITALPGNRKALLYSICSITLALSLWGARNMYVLGKPFLNKSNLWYDFYQAQVLDDDGIVSYSTFQIFHPIVSSTAHMQYIDQGEVAFMEEYRKKSIPYLQENVRDYFIRAIRRFLNTLVITPTMDTFNIVAEVPDSSLDTLVELGLATHHPYANTYRWVNVQYDIEPRRKVFYELFSPEIALRLTESLRHSKASYFYHRNKPSAVWQRRLMGTIPSLCLLISLLWARIHKTRLFRILFAVYACYLAPYILVSHYQRYQLGLLGLQCMLIMLVYLAVRDKYWNTNYLTNK